MASIAFVSGSSYPRLLPHLLIQGSPFSCTRAGRSIQPLAPAAFNTQTFTSSTSACCFNPHARMLIDLSICVLPNFRMTVACRSASVHRRACQLRVGPLVGRGLHSQEGVCRVVDAPQRAAPELILGGRTAPQGGLQHTRGGHQVSPHAADQAKGWLLGVGPCNAAKLRSRDQRGENGGSEDRRTRKREMHIDSKAFTL